MTENVISGPYDVIVSSDGATLPLMWEVEPPLEMNAYRMFRMKEEDVKRAIDALFDYRCGGFDASNRNHAQSRRKMMSCIWDYEILGEVLVDAKLAHALTLGKYDF